MSLFRSDASTSTPPPSTGRTRRVVLWIFGGLVGFVLLLLIAASLYTKTDDFQHRVGGEVVKVLEDATGGRVELGHISFSLWHLAIEADNLVIHGTEPAGEMPYLSAAKILIRIQIHTFLSHAAGSGAQSHIGLNYLRVEQPHVHLIVDKDGKTNQPEPKHPTPSTEPIQDTLLDLRAGTVELADGLAVFNDRAIPFDVAANQLNVSVKYVAQPVFQRDAKPEHYAITVDLADLRTKMQKQPEVQSRLHLAAELGRDMASLDGFDFWSGANTHLVATADIEHFNKPEWQAAVHGGVELKQLRYLAGVDGLDAGSLDLDLKGHNCVVTPQVAQKRPRFWQRHRSAPSAKVLPPDPECKAGYLMVGAMKAHNVAYRDANVRLHDINGGADLHITPTELLFTALTGTLPGGGGATGQLKIENWLGEVPADTAVVSATTVAAATTANTAAKNVGAKQPIDTLNAQVVQRAHAYLTVTVDRIPLRTIMDVTAPEHYGDLGFDTSISGPVQVQWGGNYTQIADSVTVDADLKLKPTGTKRARALSDIPVTGELQGHYDGAKEVVNLQHTTLNTPQTTLTANGVLGVSTGDPLTALQVNLQARDLGEFDQLLQTLGFQVNGKKGSSAIPVVLHGTLGFNGTARGRIADLDVKGHLTADNLALHLGTAADVHIDSVIADAEYSPTEGIAVASSTVKRASAVLSVAGSFRPHRVVSRRGVVSYNWDNELAVDATVKLDNAQMTDLLQIAGQQNKVQVTGTVAVNGHAKGTPRSLTGAGNVTLVNGVAYGENFQTISADVTAQGDQIDATSLLLQAHGLAVHGSGGYNLASKRISAQLAGQGLELAKLDTVQRLAPNDDGTLTFTADANGTLEEPNLHAKFSLTDIVAQGKSIGQLQATANSTGSNVMYELHSALLGAQIEANGRTSLLAGYQTEAKLTLTGLDINNYIAAFAPGSLKASSHLNGVLTVNGPAATPAKLSGTAEFSPVDLQLQGIELKAAEPLRASLRNGTLTLDAIHITGQDTDLRAAGTVGLFGDNDPDGGKLDLTSSGNVSVALAHSFDPQLVSSGKVTFKAAVDGRLHKPGVTGDVQLQNVNLAIDGVPNGLSNMNGSLVFNEGRLDVKNLVATTGGGQLKIGGSVSYQKGLFADLTATGDAVRVRLYGLSTTANANFHLQGGPQSLLLSGSVLITRFGVGADVDFAGFAGAGGVQAPPPPDALSNRIRMDIHVSSAPQLDFQNSYAKLAGTVDLTVRGTVATPSVLGRIQITDGSATFAGTNYQLQRGTVYFSNPVRIDPVVDLDATARVENYDITISVHGTATSLKPTYRSEPPLSEADIFNLLALGRTQEEAQLYQEQQVQAGTDPTTSALLGGALNATVSSRVGKLFGAGSIKIDPAFVGTLGNSAARITVQEPLSKQLTLVFATNVNQSAQQLIQVQYRLDENKSVVATRDESGVFSVVYKIRKRYR